MSDISTALDAIDRYARVKMQRECIPGLAVGVSDLTDVVWNGNYGFSNAEANTPVTDSTLFEIGSIGKSFACVVALQLAEEGLLDHHRLVKEYLPWFEVRTSFSPITLHHLMTHTAGLVAGPESTTEGRSEVWKLRETETGFPPGSFFHYSNVGYKIVGLILEEVLGRRCSEIIEERVLQPLNMTSSFASTTNDRRERLATGYVPLHDERPFPARGKLVPGMWNEYDTADGSICSNVVDMCSYLRMWLGRGKGASGQVLSERAFEAITHPYIKPTKYEHDESYGYGLTIENNDGHIWIGHTGGMIGYISSVRLDLDEGYGAVALTNGPFEVDDITRYALACIRQVRSGRDLPEMPAASTEIRDVDKYVGTYRAGEKRLELEARGSNLYVKTSEGETMLEFRQKERFLADTLTLRNFYLVFKKLHDGSREVHHGPDCYSDRPVGGHAEPAYPQEWRAYVGHFRSYNPWLSNFRVVVRKGSLIMIKGDGDEEHLVQLGPGRFRIGDDERSPERLRFDSIVDGRAQLAYVSGAEYARTFTP